MSDGIGKTITDEWINVYKIPGGVRFDLGNGTIIILILIIIFNIYCMLPKKKKA